MTVSIRKNADGEPVLTIKVSGSGEIFRFAYYLAQGPVDHLTHAMRTFRYLRKLWGADQFKKHDQMVTSGRVVQMGWQREHR